MSPLPAVRTTPLAERMGMLPQQLELIRRMCIRDDAPDDVLELYLHRCKSLGVDPFDKMVYVIPRNQSVQDAHGNWTKEMRWTFQASIDLFRSIAEESGDYAGQRGPQWTADGSTWVDVWLSETPPLACRVGILRTSFSEPLWVTGTYAYYVPRDARGKADPTKFWKGEKAAHQLAKCVEELALRKAFPRKLRGIFGNDEMGQAEAPAATLLPGQPTASTAPPEGSVDAEYSEPSDPAVDSRPKTGTPEGQVPREKSPRERDNAAIHARCKERGVSRDRYEEYLVAFAGPQAFPDGKPTSTVLDDQELSAFRAFLTRETMETQP